MTVRWGEDRLLASAAGGIASGLSVFVVWAIGVVDDVAVVVSVVVSVVVGIVSQLSLIHI